MGPITECFDVNENDPMELRNVNYKEEKGESFRSKICVSMSELSTEVHL